MPPQRDEQILQYAALVVVPWTALLVYDTKKVKPAPIRRSNAYVFMLAVCLLTYPQGVRT